MPNCKITKSFLKELSRMTSGCRAPCEQCSLNAKADSNDKQSCVSYMLGHIDEVIETIQAWSDSNPPRTRMDDFYEKHPNAEINSLGSPIACCKSLGYIEACPVINSSSKSCLDCWSAPIES